MSYPKLEVVKGVVSGSVKIKDTRLPLWAFAVQVVTHSWGYVDMSYGIEEAGLSRETFGVFLFDLFQQRNEFGELILVLADVERLDRELMDAEDDALDALSIDWKRRPADVKRVRAALHACLKALDET